MSCFQHKASNAEVLAAIEARPQRERQINRYIGGHGTIRDQPTTKWYSAASRDIIVQEDIDRRRRGQKDDTGWQGQGNAASGEMSDDIDD